MQFLSPVKTHESTWDPSTAQVTLNARLDARLVPQGSAMRLDYSHVVVLDDFIGEPERQGLLEFLTQPDWDHSNGPPAEKWERETADGAGLPKTWGLKDSVLHDLATAELPAMQEVHARLANLYPDFTITHMPSDMIQHGNAPHAAAAKAANGKESSSVTAAPATHDSQPNTMDTQTDATQHSAQRQASSACAGHVKVASSLSTTTSSTSSSSSSSSAEQSQAEQHTASVDCNQFVGNAAVYGDCYTWHVDADPTAFPDSPWVDTFGHYCNGDPGTH